MPRVLGVSLGGEFRVALEQQCRPVIVRAQSLRGPEGAVDQAIKRLMGSYQRRVHREGAVVLGQGTPRVQLSGFEDALAGLCDSGSPTSKRLPSKHPSPPRRVRSDGSRIARRVAADLLPTMGHWYASLWPPALYLLSKPSTLTGDREKFGPLFS